MKTIVSCHKCGAPLPNVAAPCPRCDQEEYRRATQKAHLFQGFIRSAAIDRLRQALRIRAA
jgi:ribosomal protein L40E